MDDGGEGVHVADFFGEDSGSVVVAVGGDEVFGGDEGLGWIVEAFGEDFGLDLAIGLEAAEFGGGFEEYVQGLGAGAIYGGLVDVRVSVFGGGAAVEAPGGSSDFAGEGLFEGGRGAESFLHGGEEAGAGELVFGGWLGRWRHGFSFDAVWGEFLLSGETVADGVKGGAWLGEVSR